MQKSMQYFLNDTGAKVMKTRVKEEGRDVLEVWEEKPRGEIVT